MDSTSKILGKMKSKGPTRRIWSMYEEQALINAMKDLITNGYKADNGFKTGYLGMLEQTLNKLFPRANLKSDPHINSKIHVWKKNYNTLTLLLGKSGIGWNSSANTIDIENESAFDEVCKVDSNARLVRFKSHPFYPDWVEIFGKDRATGQHAEGIEEAADDMENHNLEPEKYTPKAGPFGKKNTSVSGPNNGGPSEHVSDNNEAISANGNPPQKKRKTRDEDIQLVEMMKNVIQTSDGHFLDLMKHIGTEPVSDEDQDMVFAELILMTGLQLYDRIRIAKHVCKNKQDVRFFLRMDVMAKAAYVGMILDGKI